MEQTILIMKNGIVNKILNMSPKTIRERRDVSKNDYVEWINKVFQGSNKSEKSTLWAGIDFLKGYYKEYGKEKFIILVNNTNITTTTEGEEFIKQLTQQ